MLISNTMRNGTVREEPWDQAVGNRTYKIYQVRTAASAKSLLAKARSSIGRVKYNLTQYNCEHFVRELITGKAISTQVQWAAIGALVLGVGYLLAQRRKAV